ncbi:hypothetical protein M409DRAFT_50320 [Zasmidium cellare ATCC 36951]|uniref:DRBM domain-containing protein n=1 Tax=Zasmidium cellare ATCC 36951 TaxID=1080233 RepID=A0A6A6D0P7_ZASCE|nr:uncharacterized protein M409DRAFT_50320 [Zasmidium cellare ATCC 36951]KAF2171649.1 hypothetical protein M409DRAFT_50320 [Zasmidium cellare ATCC 36951]
MSSTGSGPSPPNAHGAAPSPNQTKLIDFCRTHGYRAPNFQVVSDRRGGRTAWSCMVTIQGTQIPARFWYDGQYVNNAKEDAAEKALQMLGVVPSPPGPQVRQPQPGQMYGAVNSQ